MVQLIYSRVEVQWVLKCAEHFATYMENRFRAEHGLPLRKFYGKGSAFQMGIMVYIPAFVMTIKRAVVIIPDMILIKNAVRVQKYRIPTYSAK